LIKEQAYFHYVSSYFFLYKLTSTIKAPIVTQSNSSVSN